MNIVDFVKEFAETKDGSTMVFLEWWWMDEGLDEEYSFEGTPSEFVEYYTKYYDCIDAYDFTDVKEFKVSNFYGRTSISIIIVKE